MKQAPISVAGMPPLDPDAPPVSFFEFWPTWLFYAPVWLWIFALMIRHRSIRLPLLANPNFPAGGLVGEEKSTLFSLFTGPERERLPDWMLVKRWCASAARQLPLVESRMRAAGLGYPLVAKPDIGCRGAGVRPLRSRTDLHRYLSDFPTGGQLLLQRMAEMEGEAGVFYVRQPGHKRGSIISLTLKYFPHVVGDGRATLRELILRDPRAGRVPHLYLRRFADRLDDVLPLGSVHRLVFSGSHSKGAIFRNGNAWITEAMRARFDAIADGIPEFHFGRFDVRFNDFEAFRRGADFAIIEYNGAGAEATHIWDSSTQLVDAWRALFAQFSILFRIGAANRARGFRPESWRASFTRWRAEKKLAGRYPLTE
jgi:hypothetical protein